MGSKNSRGKAIEKMHKGKNGFFQKILRHIHVKEKVGGSIKEMTKFPLNDTVLLGGIGKGGFMDDSVGMEEMGERSVDIISCIVGAEATDGGGKLSGDERENMNKGLGEVRYVLKEIGPQETSSVVDEDDQLARAQGAGNWGRPLDIVESEREGR